MKITIKAKPLAAALRQVSMLVRAATVKRFPILGAVRLTAPEGAAVTLTSNDLDAQVAVTVAATVALAGEVAIDAAALSALIAGGPKDSSITLASEDGGVVVHCGPARFELPAVPAADLVSLALVEETGHAVIGRKDAVEIFGRVAFAMSTEQTRYYLNGIYLHASPGGLAAVATDGHRLARVIVSSAGGLWQGESCIVPSAAVKGINKLLAAHRDMAEVTLRRSRSLFEIEGGSFRLTSKLVDGTFPDYQRVIGSGGDGKNTVTVCCSDLTAALLRAATAAGNSKMPTAGLVWGNPGQDGLHVCATDGGAAHDVVPLEAVHGKGRVAFQVRHGVDALKAFDKHEVVTIDAGNGCVPVYMTGAGEAGPTPFLVVQMPVTWPKLAGASA